MVTAYKSRLQAFTAASRKAIEGAAKDIGDAIIDEAARNLVKNRSVNTGTLLRSLESVVQPLDPKSPVTVIVAARTPYSYYVEAGSAPHWAPIGPLRAWAKAKGINPYAVQRSIAMKGTRPKPYLRPAITHVTASRERVQQFFDANLEREMRRAGIRQNK